MWPRDNALLGVIRKTWGAHCDELRFVVGKQTFDTAKLGRSIDRSIIFVCVTEFFAYFYAKINYYYYDNLGARPEDGALFVPIDLKRGAKAGVEHSWELSWRMWAKIGAEYASAGDFFLKTDAQTFVAVENLRSLLRYYDSSAQHYLGQNNYFSIVIL